MKRLEDIKNDLSIINEIDWTMTPEEAVLLYLEWGNNWAHGRVVRSKSDVSHYFVVNTWGREPVVYLIKRNSEEALELAEFGLPDNIRSGFLDSIGHTKGVHAVEGKVREWLQGELTV